MIPSRHRCPLAAPVEAEIRLAAADIGFIRSGDIVTVKVDAFDSFEHGSAVGHLAWISEGAFKTDEVGKPVDPSDRARVTIDRLNFVGGRRLSGSSPA